MSEFGKEVLGKVLERIEKASPDEIREACLNGEVVFEEYSEMLDRLNSKNSDSIRKLETSIQGLKSI